NVVEEFEEPPILFELGRNVLDPVSLGGVLAGPFEDQRRARRGRRLAVRQVVYFETEQEIASLCVEIYLSRAGVLARCRLGAALGFKRVERKIALAGISYRIARDTVDDRPKLTSDFAAKRKCRVNLNVYQTVQHGLDQGGCESTLPLGQACGG